MRIALVIWNIIQQAKTRISKMPGDRRTVSSCKNISAGLTAPTTKQWDWLMNPNLPPRPSEINQNTSSSSTSKVLGPSTHKCRLHRSDVYPTRFPIVLASFRGRTCPKKTQRGLRFWPWREEKKKERAVIPYLCPFFFNFPVPRGVWRFELGWWSHITVLYLPSLLLL